MSSPPVHDKPHRCSRAHLGAGADADVMGSCQLLKVMRVTCGDKKKKKTNLSESLMSTGEKRQRGGWLLQELCGDPGSWGLQDWWGSCRTWAAVVALGPCSGSPLSPRSAPGHSPGPQMQLQHQPRSRSARLGRAAGAGVRRGVSCTGGPAGGWGETGTASAGRQVLRTSRASHPRPPRNCLCSRASCFPT